MEKLSRVKKYEELRKQIDLNTEDKSENNRIEPVLFKKMELTEEIVPKRERELTIEKEQSDTFINEYMDDLIKDVKQYNKEKGLLHSDITEVDILNQLRNPSRLKREDYVKTIQEEPKVIESTLVQSKKEIAKQIQELLNEDNDSGMNVSKVESSNVVEEIKEENKELVEEIHEEKNKQLEILNEKTQQIKIQIDKHEEEMNELSEGIDKTNRLLNILLIFLVIALFLVIGFTIFVILRSSGRI